MMMALSGQTPRSPARPRRPALDMRPTALANLTNITAGVPYSSTLRKFNLRKSSKQSEMQLSLPIKISNRTCDRRLPSYFL
jgi:hypothetical protein